MKKVQFTETALRDASQSLIATRLSYADMEPILEKIDKAGYYSAECWGGATFDVCRRFPPQRVRIKKLEIRIDTPDIPMHFHVLESPW